MLDVAVAYNRYKFLGEEFLTWLWFQIDTNQPFFKTFDHEITSFHIGKRIVLENRKTETLERITIKGDDAGFEEGILALRKGALVTELNLALHANNQEWKFTIKGESLNLSSVTTPKTGQPETTEDLEGFVIEKAYHYDKIINFLGKTYSNYINLRISDSWKKRGADQIREWIHANNP
ncbi:MAG: hypothetical protein PVF56_16635 [Desulfobacterales bacterium]|jgi:hypothetical protein